MTASLASRLSVATLPLLYSVLPLAALNSTGNPAKWAQAKRYLARGESPLSQQQATKYDFKDTPWCEEICEGAIRPDVQKTVLWCGSNMGKSSCFLNVLGWIIEEAPGHVLWALKTQGQMDEISKKTIAPFLAATPSLNNVISPPKSRDSGNTISIKLFPSGSLSMIGTETIVGFRANRSPYVIGDEIDSWAGDVGGEGDPVQLLMKRSDGFPNSLRLLGSTGGTKGQSRIAPEYEQSDQRKWFVKCRKCSEEQLILWSGIKWPKGEPQKARWHCRYCDAAHDDPQRQKAVRNGYWKATRPFSGVRGYWINGLNSLFPPNKGFESRLHQWAREWEEACHDASPETSKERKKVIIQTLFTELWEDEEDAKPQWAEIAARREKGAWKKTALPKKIIWLTAGVDVHPDRLECTLLAWGRGEESWVLEHVMWDGDPREPDIWGRLEAYILQARTREDGATLTVRAVGVDTGHPPTQRMAYAFIRPRQARNWFALKGSSLVDAPVIVRPKKTTTVDRVKLLTVGGHRVKGLIYDRCAIQTESTPGYMHFAADLGDTFFQQLLSEDSYPVWKNGVRLREFKKPTQTTRNEALDCTTYGYCALIALGPLNHDAEDARLIAEIKSKETEEEYDDPMQYAGASGGFVGGRGWKI